MLVTNGRPAANNNTPLSRKEMMAAADAVLKANPEPKQATVRIRYRGSRPAWNWLEKHDKHGAAALWLIARRHLPQPANDNTANASGMGLDRRKDGKPRGPSAEPRSLEAYLDLPAAKPSPLTAASAERVAVRPLTGFHGRFGLKPAIQAVVQADCTYTLADDAIAYGACFLGAEGGLGRPKAGKQRGDVRRVDAPEQPDIPEEIDRTLEVMLAGGNVAEVGQALGAKGGYADRRGGIALLAAAEWAKGAVAASLPHD
jgi:hypothetical protein